MSVAVEVLGAACSATSLGLELPGAAKTCLNLIYTAPAALLSEAEQKLADTLTLIENYENVIHHREMTRFVKLYTA